MIPKRNLCVSGGYTSIKRQWAGTWGVGGGGSLSKMVPHQKAPTFLSETFIILQPPSTPNLRIRIWRCWFYEDVAKNFKKFKVSFIESWEENRLLWLVWLARGSTGLVSNMAGTTLTLSHSRNAVYTQVCKNRKGYRCVKYLGGTR